MTHEACRAVVARYPTAGGGIAVVERHAGFWFRYTWKCWACDRPRSGWLSLLMARWQGWRHSRRCPGGVPGDAG